MNEQRLTRKSRNFLRSQIITLIFSSLSIQHNDFILVKDKFFFSSVKSTNHWKKQVSIKFHIKSSFYVCLESRLTLNLEHRIENAFSN
jgi:hypothetical protein